MAFRPDARLHVVLGPNEAGKSSALAAITDLLFKIGERTDQDFLHPGSDMRLGAEIQARDGRSFSFHRRKGRTKTLIDAQGAAIGEDALAPFLGGLTRSVFCRAFGLGAKALREGGDEMLKSDGEVGATLFAAASGLRGYVEVARGLVDEAKEIFAPQARGRVFNEATKRFEVARAAMKTDGLGADAWRKLTDGLGDAAAQLDAVSRAREAIVAEAARLARLRRVQPIVADLDGFAAEAEMYAGLPDVPDALIDDLVRLKEAAESALTRLSEANAARDGAERDLPEEPIDAGYGAHAEAVSRLFRGLDDYAKSLRDLPRILSERDVFAEDLARLAVRVGLPDIDRVRTRQPSDAARARIAAAIRDGREHEQALKRLAADLEQKRAHLTALRGARAVGATPIDPAPHRAALDGLEPIFRETSRRDALASDIRREERSLKVGQSRLSPPIVDLGALSAASLPTRAALARMASAFDSHARDVARAQDRIAAALKDARETGQRIGERGAERPVPDRARLAGLRAERDDAWSRVRAAAFGAPQALSGGALAAEAARFESLSFETDRLADDLALDAGRAAEQASDVRRLAAASAEAAEAEAELATLRSDGSAREAEWRALWAPSGIAPLNSAEMIAWLSEAANLIERHDALALKMVDLAGISDRLDSVRAPLLNLAERIGSIGLDGLDVALIAHRLEESLRSLADAWNAARESETRIRTAEDGVSATETALDKARATQDAWRRAWVSDCESLGLGTEARLAEAEMALAAWSDVPGALASLDNRQGRISGLRRDVGTYEAEARAVLAAIAAGGSSPPEPIGQITDAITLAQERAQAAREETARRIELGKRLAALTRERDEAATASQDADRMLADVRLRAGIPADAALATLLDGCRARQEIRAKINAARQELGRAADGIAEAVLRDQLTAISADQIEARLVMLEEDEARLDQEGKEAYAERARLQAVRGGHESGLGAEVAAAQKQSAEAEIRAAARRYVVLRLGALLLQGAVERHRTGQQDPLIRRAGALFSGLTGGAFADLAQAYDSDDAPILAGLRTGGGKPVPVGGMSEGTRDQLYLALRLAYLEDFALRADPAPFVGDDIFASFDDARAGHGLEALAAIGGSVQPILFTHHEHLARLAHDRLGQAADVIELR